VELHLHGSYVPSSPVPLSGGRNFTCYSPLYIVWGSLKLIRMYDVSEIVYSPFKACDIVDTILWCPEDSEFDHIAFDNYRSV
jgi:hypothetical protein